VKGEYGFPSPEWDRISDLGFFFHHHLIVYCLFYYFIILFLFLFLSAKSFVRKLLVVNFEERLSAKEALEHPWILVFCYFGLLCSHFLFLIFRQMNLYLNSNIRKYNITPSLFILT